jgi:hypothetical protein
LGRTPIERVVLPVRSRDELPPVLAGLQWIFQTPELNRQVFDLLEEKVVGGKKATGRPGFVAFRAVSVDFFHLISW